MACRKSAEAAQLDPSALGELVGDGIENGADHAFNLPLREVGKVGAKLLHQFGTDHHYPAMENRPRPLLGPFLSTLSGNLVSRKKDLPGVCGDAPRGAPH